MRLSCNGCRVHRKCCNDKCSIKPCLDWIKSPQPQANATLFLDKFYGRAALLNLLNAAPLHLRPDLYCTTHVDGSSTRYTAPPIYCGPETGISAKPLSKPCSLAHPSQRWPSTLLRRSWLMTSIMCPVQEIHNQAEAEG